MIIVVVAKNQSMIVQLLVRKRNPNYQKVCTDQVSDMELYDLSGVYSSKDLRTSSAGENRVQRTDQVSLTILDHDLLICSSTVHGFSLKHRQ